MVLPPIIAGKAAAQASAPVTKALTGDIYVRRWTTTAKKGKRKGMPVEHEVRVNAVTAAVAAVGVGLAALAGGVALWATQQKIAKSDTAKKTLIRRIRFYSPVFEQVKVIDQEAWTEERITNNYHDEVGHYETVAGATIVCPVDGSSFNAAPKNLTEQQNLDRWMTLHERHNGGQWTYTDGKAWFVDIPAGVYPSTEVITHSEQFHYEPQLSQESRVIVLTARGVPLATYKGTDISDAKVLGARLATDYAYKRTVRELDSTDRYGPYHEIAKEYEHATAYKLELGPRKGLLE